MRTVFSFVVVAVATAHAAWAQPLTFARDDYASVTGARGIVAGDFDRNGWPDVAQANTGRNTVAILLNHSGALTKTFEVAVGTGPFDLAAADFNRDGVLDLVVANADADSLSILIGTGTGTFSRTVDLARTSVLTSPRGVTVADVDGNGTLDVVVTEYNSNAVSAWLGDGSGAFADGGSFVGYAQHPQGVAVADLNHDGLQDLIAAYDSSGGLAVLYRNPALGFPYDAPKAVAGPHYLNVLTLGDFNRDGRTDVAAASTRDSRVAVFLGTASGLTFSRAYTTGASPRGIATADLNGDGALDLITGNFGSSTVSVLLGSTSSPGTFAAAMDVASNQGSRAVAVADFNGDGRLDVATGDQSVAFTTVLVNQTILKASAYAFTKVPLGTPSNTWSSGDDVRLADFNRDGRLDVATLGETYGTIAVMLTGGSTVTLTAPTSGGWLSDDFNRDGNPDLLSVAGYPSSSIGAYLGDGRGRFTAAPRTSTPMSAYRAAAGDLNGDAAPDVVLSGSWGSGWALQVLMGTGSGTFNASTPIPVSDFAAGLLVHDLNGDGKADVAALMYRGRLEVSYGDGAGGFTSVKTFAVNPNNIPTSISVGDLNRDGRIDLVVSSDAQMAVLLATADGLGAPAYLAGVNGNWSGPAVADVNGDGLLDITTDSGAILFGNGDGTFGAPSRFDFGGNSIGVRVADFNADGVPDVIVGGTLGEANVFLNSRSDVNHPPTADAGPDRTFNYQSQFGMEDLSFGGSGTDPDSHALTYEWRNQNGEVVSDSQWVDLFPALMPGTYTYTLTVTDGRGGSATDSTTITIEPTKEIVLYTGDGSYATGNAWITGAFDPSAAGEMIAYNPNANAPKITTPLANPPSALIVPFVADPTQTYKLWVRLKADNNSWSNDSVWVQFSGAADAAGNAVYRNGTTSALPVNLEECSGCGVSGWGWEDDGWGAPNVNGVTLHFPEGGRQFIYIQQREDGVSIDQIVLSAEKYRAQRPGAAKNDTTILPRTVWPEG
jgi:hypothetical protein